MVKIMPPHIVNVRNTNINTSVIQSGEQPSDDDVQEDETSVGLVAKSLDTELTNPEERPQVVIFTKDIFDGVGVDGVDISSPRSVLEMVMFVDERIQPFDVENSVKDGVEEIIEDNDAGEEGETEDEEILQDGTSLVT